MTSKVYAAGVATFAPGRINLGATHKRIFFPHPTRRNDTQFGGLFRVSGTTAIAGTPDLMVDRLVVLLDERTKRPVRSMVSTPQGDYDFRYVARGPWSVISYDHTGEYNAVIASNVLGKPM